MSFFLSLVKNQPSFGQIKSDQTLMKWNGGALVVALLPLISFVVARHGVSQDDKNNKNNKNGGGNWFSNLFGGGGQGGNNKNNGDEVRNGAWWWPASWGVGLEQGNAAAQDPQLGIIPAYVWTILLFICLVLYGNHAWTRRNGASKDTLNKGLMAYVNTAVICIILASHAVQVEGDGIKETGWYGQQSVLLVLTCLLGIVFSAYFMFTLRGSVGHDSSSPRGNRYYGSNDADAMAYHRDTSRDVEMAAPSSSPPRTTSQPKQAEQKDSSWWSVINPPTP